MELRAAATLAGRDATRDQMHDAYVTTVLVRERRIVEPDDIGDRFHRAPSLLAVAARG